MSAKSTTTNKANKTARPLKNYVAVESIKDGEYLYHEGTSIIKSASTSTQRFLRGIILKKGPLVGDEVSVGDEVLYECMSAHPSQSAPINADLFGGSVDGDAYVIPVWPSALLGTGEIEEEKAKRQREIDRLSLKAKKGWLDEVDRAELGNHERRIALLNLKRKGRARGSSPLPIKDPAKGSGVVAVILKEI